MGSITWAGNISLFVRIWFAICTHTYTYSAYTYVKWHCITFWLRIILVFQGEMCCFGYCSETRPFRFTISVGSGVRGAGEVYTFIIRLWLHSAHLHSINITILCSFVPLRHAGPPPPRREKQTEWYINYSLLWVVDLMALIVDVIEVLLV